MSLSLLWTLLLLILIASYLSGYRKAKLQAVVASQPLQSLPFYHGLYVGLWALVPAICLFSIGSLLNFPHLFPTFHWGITTLSLLGALYAWQRVSPIFNARKVIERWIKSILFLSAGFAVLVTFAIALSMILESIRFFSFVPITDFLFGLRWSPGVLSPETQVGYFGIIPLLVGTTMVTLIAMVVAIPAGLFSAIYLSQYAPARIRSFSKPLLEVLAGIPTVVYGFFALVAMAPLLQIIGQNLGLSIAAESALGIGLVMGIMIMPYIASLSDDILRAVPIDMLDGSLALGATHSESIKRVILPTALPGIMASILLAVSRAIGETMIVVMAAGYSANLSANPLEAVTTVTVQIVSLLTGDQEFHSPKTLAAFALGLTLFIITLFLNVIALRIVHRYKEQYE